MADRFERFRQFQMNATECVICLGTLTQPKVLSCLHTFCLSCLDKLHRSSNNSELICPTCRAGTALPPDGVTGLRTNFIVDQMLEFRQLCSYVTCDACADDASSSSIAVATVYCGDCGDNLCENCVSAHRKIRTLKSHRLVDIGTSDADRLKALLCDRPEHCAEHPNQELALYCTDCSTSICLSCCVLAHRTHSYVDIRERANGERKDLEKVIDVVSEKLSDFRRASTELELRLTTATESATQTVGEISRRTNEFIAHVRCQESCLVETVQKYQHQVEKQIESMLEDVQTKIAVVENFSLLCQKLKDSGTHSEVIHLSSRLCTTADELRETEFRTVSLPSLLFTPTNGNLSEINVLGEVAVIEADGECNRTVLSVDCLSNCEAEDVRRRKEYGKDNSKVKRNSYDREGNRSQDTYISRSESAVRVIPKGVAETVQRAPLRRSKNSTVKKNSTEKNRVIDDCVSSSSSTVLTTSLQKSASDGYQSNLDVLHISSSLETPGSSFSNASNSSSNTTSVDLCSDTSSADQSENEDNDCRHHVQSGRRNGSHGRPSTDRDTNRHRLSNNRYTCMNAHPSSIPLFPISGRCFEDQPPPKQIIRRRGSSDIETIPGAEPIIGLALLDSFLFVVRRNANELELYDQKSLEPIARHPIADLSQPTDLTACARTHTLYIGHTRRLVFSLKVSDSTAMTCTMPTPQKLSVAFSYARLSTTTNCSVLMGCPKAEAILEYKEDPHWTLIRTIRMGAGTYPTGVVQLSSNRFAVSSKTNVVYIITSEGSTFTCEEVSSPHNMSHMAIDVTGTNLLVADCYGHQIRRLEPNGPGIMARSSSILKAKTISRPCRLWTDTVDRRLFVGTTQGDVKVLRLD